MLIVLIKFWNHLNIQKKGLIVVKDQLNEFVKVK
jgi:hypothetical protein